MSTAQRSSRQRTGSSPTFSSRRLPSSTSRMRQSPSFADVVRHADGPETYRRTTTIPVTRLIRPTEQIGTSSRIVGLVTAFATALTTALGTLRTGPEPARTPTVTVHRAAEVRTIIPAGDFIVDQAPVVLSVWGVEHACLSLRGQWQATLVLAPAVEGP